MPDYTRDQLRTVGELLRFTTPILIGVIGFFTIDKLNTIDRTQLSHGRQLTAISERITRLEHLEAEIMRLENAYQNVEGRLREIEIDNGRAGR